MKKAKTQQEKGRGDHRGFRSNNSAAGARIEERTHAPNGLRLRAPMTIQISAETVHLPSFPLLAAHSLLLLLWYISAFF